MQATLNKVGVNASFCYFYPNHHIMKKITNLLFAVLISASSQAQHSEGGYPLGLGKSALQKSIPAFKLSPIDNQSLLSEDAVHLAQGEKSLRFGLDVPVNISPNTHGIWTTLPNGTAVWQLRVKSSNATGLNFVFDEFNIPQGARLFIYSEDGSIVQGAFTENNVNKLNNFATLPIASNEVVLEYSEPSSQIGKGRIHLSYIIHNYRDFSKSLKDFGESGNCNNNVVCPEGDPWSNEIRSNVVLLTSNNSRFCSGAAVNNTSNDQTPYVLTADHCGAGATDIFLFNYFSPTCTPNADGFTTDVVIGCTPRANNSGSDFSLVELSDVIPPEYNAYLSGWSRQSTAPATATCIHHPAGDVMKITFNTDMTDNQSFSGADCWHIPTWEDGTTEGGSSGSPLYNENHQIIGQLYGGTASCGNNIDDYFGRFVTSWNGNSANVRLKDWLDPSNLGVESIAGAEASVPAFNLDARLQTIISPVENYCNSNSFTPEIKVRNSGITTLTSLTINYSFGSGSSQNYLWNGSLASNQSVNILLPSMNLASGNGQVFNVSIVNPNGAIDEQPNNNALSITVNASIGLAYNFNLVTDNFPEETAYRLINTGTNEVIRNVPFGQISGGTSNTAFCLPDGCYKFTIYDDYGDGICCGFFSGNGSYTLTDNLGIVLGTGGEFDDSASFTFCINDVSIGSQINKESLIHIYPNPANDFLNIQINSSIVKNYMTVKLYDVTGKLLLNKSIQTSNSAIAIDTLANGVYWMQWSDDTSIITKKFVITH